MRIGIVADVHCNLEGLQAALERMGPVDELLCAGDAVYQYRFSNEVIELLRERGARYVLGNHELTLLGTAGERARSAPHVRQENLDYTASAPTRIDVAVGGKRLVMVHASPFEPFDEYLYPSSANLSQIAGLDADYVILGHTHYAMAVQVGRALVINPGSAGEARDYRNRFLLSYAVLDTSSGEVTFESYPDPHRPFEMDLPPGSQPWPAFSSTNGHRLNVVGDSLMRD